MAISPEDSALGSSSVAENGHSIDVRIEVSSEHAMNGNGNMTKSFIKPSPMRLQLPGKIFDRSQMEEQSTSGVDTGVLDDEAMTPERSVTPSVSAPPSPSGGRRDRLASAVTVNSALSHIASVFRKSPRRRGSTPALPQPGKMTAKDKKLLKMILVIFVCFLVCYLPITITKTFKDIDLRNLNILSYILIYLTTCTNPIIYVVMSSEYRQAYKNLLMCRREWVDLQPAGPSRSVSQRA